MGAIASTMRMGFFVKRIKGGIELFYGVDSLIKLKSRRRDLDTSWIENAMLSMIGRYVI